MCMGGAPSIPDTSAQMAEAERQRDEDQKRLAEERKQQQEEAARQREADQRRFEEQRKADLIEAERVRQVQQAEYDRRFAAEQAERQRIAAMEEKRYNDLVAAQRAEAERQRQIAEQTAAQEKAQQEAAAAEAERQRLAEIARQKAVQDAAEADAKARAGRVANFTTSRTNLLNDATGRVNSEFDRYNDDYYNKFAQDFINYYQPELKQQFDDTQKANTFKLANSGNLNSSAAAEQFGRLDQRYATQQADIARKAGVARDSLRADIEKQRSDSLAAVRNAVSAWGDPDYGSDASVSDAISRLGASIGGVVSGAATTAGGVTPPTPTDLGNVFTDLTTTQTAGGPGIDVGMLPGYTGSTAAAKKKPSLTVVSNV